ncbi:MAG TPA: GGDEF domain-containing protein [Acidimicrobiia bacterium]|nr:GGDEF domain-containing protein [Acidimicrobiia bacterium]
MPRSSESPIPSDESAQYQALFDTATGLPKWALLLDRTTVALARARRVNRKVAVFVLNDVRTFGGALPDLTRFVQTLAGKVRIDDTIARVGERTFVVVCNNIGKDKDAALVAQRLVQNTDVACKLGIALSSADEDAAALLAAALKESTRTNPAA